MLKGDLASSPLTEVLTQLAAGDASGCLHLTSTGGDTARIYLRAGRVYAALAPGPCPQLGARLVSGGALGPEALAEALEAQRTELQGWRLGELLVHLGCLDRSVVEAFAHEQLRDSLSRLLLWHSGAWKLRINERTSDDVAPPSAVADLLADIALRRTTWAGILRTVHGPDAVPVLSAVGSADDQTVIDAEAWSLLCKVDGVRSLAELAAECGFTLYEAGQVVCTLVEAGLLEVEAPEAGEAAAGEAAAVEPAAVEPAALAAQIVGALTRPVQPSTVPAQGSAPPAEQDDAARTAARHLERPADDAAVNGSISRVSAALSALLGPATVGDDMFSAPLHRPARRMSPADTEDPRKIERARREAARRARDGEELVAAQADLEAARAAEQARRDDLLPDGHVADVVDLQEVRREAEAVEAARQEHARQEEETRQKEEARAVAEAEAATRARLAAEADAARLAEDAHVAEQARLAEEVRLAEESRSAAEAAEQARRDDEIRIAEEAARAEQVRLDEQARLVEEARLTAEARLAEAAAEQFRREEEVRLAEEATFTEQVRLVEEAWRAEEALLAEEARLAVEAAELVRHDEQAALAERVRLADEARLAEEHRLAEEQAWRDEQAAAERARREEQDRLHAEADQRAAATAELAAMAFELTPPPDDVRLTAETQAAAFAELSASASQEVPEQVAAAPAAAALAAEVDEAHEPRRMYGDRDTDTAALLRELSSLGLDEDPPASPVTRTARATSSRPVPTAAQKKRKGLFGRG